MFAELFVSRCTSFVNAGKIRSQTPTLRSDVLTRSAVKGTLLALPVRGIWALLPAQREGIGNPGA